MKKQKLSVRLLSLLITLCLLIGILPSGMAVTGDLEAYHYYFMRLQWGSTNTEGYNPEDMTEWGWEDTAANPHNRVTDPFIYYGKSEGTSWTWRPSSANPPEFGPYFIGAPGEWVGYTIRVGENAKYIPTITYAGVTDGGSFNAYIAPISATDPRDEQYFIGTFNTKTSVLAYQQKAVLNEVLLTAGDYAFIYEVAAGQSTPASWVSGLNLDPAANQYVDDTLDSLTATASESTIKPSSEGTQINISAKTELGWELDPQTLTVTYESLDTSVATVSATGFVTPIAKGTATIEVTAVQGDVTKTATVSIRIKDGKDAPTYITYEKRQAAKENIANYDWAKDTLNFFIGNIENYVGNEEWAWNLVTSQDIPRTITVAGRMDPELYTCKYCGKDISKETGNPYGWKYDVVNAPWKIRCPLCDRQFPSNDFGKFYEAGINEHGFFDYEYALEHGSQYLTNDLYPEKGAGWGVDDSRGYITNETYQLKISDALNFGTQYRRHNYIAYYNNWALWYGPGVDYSVQYLASVYALTGDAKYGRVGAILMDRIADMYPDMYVADYYPYFYNSDSNLPRGRVVGSIWEAGLANGLAMAYDMLYPMYDDPTVVDFLHEKAVQYNLGDARGAHGTANELRGGVGNDKSTPEKIRQNIENGLLREIIKGVRVEGNIIGNQGMREETATAAAVVLDSMPETAETLDWVLGEGGNVLSDMIGSINRDGQGTEAAPGYSDTWIASYSGIVDLLESYEGYEAANLYKNPKFVKLIKTNFPLMLTRNGTAPIGDSSGVAGTTINVSMERLINAFLRTGDVEIAQYIYFMNGNKVDGIEANIYSPATKVAPMIQAVIDEHGEYPFDESSAMTGSFGFFALRDGVYNQTTNTQRDFWMYFGRSTNHGHPSSLNLGIDAYGMAISSEFGYPESTSATPRTENWDRATITHNTVQVNDKKQSKITGAQALHFDGDNDGRVQVMDAKAPNAYSETSEYRRTTVMVDYDEEISYAVDFFRVTGGSSHTFSFQVISDRDPITNNLTMVKQNGGTYAGATVAYGNYSQTSGYDGFYDVSRAANPGKNFTVDFKVKDHRKRLTEPRDVHLRMTQLNDFDVSEVALAKGEPPKVNNNPDYLQFVLVDRRGSNLDSLFTTVFEPYDKSPYIEKQESVSIVRTGGNMPGATDMAKAVKVTMKDGRVDYIVYATNNGVRYKVDNNFDFQGFVGVVSIEDGEVAYCYLNDGTLLGSNTATASYTGTVTDFTKDLSFENQIVVKPTQEMNLNDLVGRYIFVNGKSHSYKIRSATKRSDGNVVLDIGDFSMLESVKDAANPLTGGYNYEIATGQTFEIPLSKVVLERFSVVAQPCENGRISVNKNSALPGETVTVTTMPNMNYELKTVYVNGAAIDGNTFIMPEEDVTVTAEFTLIGVSISTFNGAQIRTSGVQGIRFVSEIDKNDVFFSRVKEFGTVLIPTADLKDISELQIGAVLNGHAVAKVPAVYYFDETEETITFTAVLTQLTEQYYTTEYTARAYAILNDGTVVYADKGTSRSVYYVAKRALYDPDESEGAKAIYRAIVDAVEGDGDNDLVWPWKL